MIEDPEINDELRLSQPHFERSARMDEETSAFEIDWGHFDEEAFDVALEEYGRHMYDRPSASSALSNMQLLQAVV